MSDGTNDRETNDREVVDPSLVALMTGLGVRLLGQDLVDHMTGFGVQVDIARAATAMVVLMKRAMEVGETPDFTKPIVAHWRTLTGDTNYMMVVVSSDVIK